jgi:hypothetical protein
MPQQNSATTIGRPQAQQGNVNANRRHEAHIFA